jgi:arsenate reductase
MRPRHVLFVCVANSSRSQMAAAIARALAPLGVKISSAGSRPAPIHPLAVEVLAELGFDVSQSPSRRLEEIADDVDVVITLCDEDVAAAFPGSALRIRWPLPDPTQLTGSEAARLEAFRNIRDELMRRLVAVFGGPRVVLGAA